MSEIGPEHPLSYREEIVAPLFRALSASDSSVVLGPASMGKSRLIQFILRPEVQRHYLGERTRSALIALVDHNRLAELSDWGFYELLLTTLVEASGGHPASQPLRAELNTLRREVITSRDAVLARRHVELALHMLCQEHGLSLCLILDEFDETYRELPSLTLANLRALRDANKYRLCYILMLRELPSLLRPIADVEGFYELFSRSIFGLRPYRPADAERIIDQLEARKGLALAPHARTKILELSGGHPGLIVALFDAMLTRDAPADGTEIDWASALPTIQEEGRKIWSSLSEGEQLALSQYTRGKPIGDESVLHLLRLKGLLPIVSGAESTFSPLFTRFVLSQNISANERLSIDTAARVVRLGDQSIRDLTATEFDLLQFLAEHLGQVCTRDTILNHLYPDEAQSDELRGTDNRVDTLVRRIREKIEPVREHPAYLLTVRGKGYRLVDRPEERGSGSEEMQL